MTAAMVGIFSLVVTEARWSTVVTVMLLALVLVEAPHLALVLAGGAGLVLAMRRLRVRRRMATQDAADLAMLCDLTALSLTGGLGLHASLGLAAEETGGRVGSEVAGVLRSALVGGTAAEMTAADGIGRPLYQTVARATVTGAGVEQPVAGLADELNAELAASRLETVRRKPVAMLFPLTLLILPGFLLLALVPIIVDAMSRLDM